MCDETDNNEIKKILNNKYEECNKVLKKLKKKKKRIKIFYILVATTIIICQSTVVTISSFTIPPFIVPIICGTSALLTTITSTFEIKDLRSKTTNKIAEIKKLKNYIDQIELEGESDLDKIREIVNSLI